PRDPAEKDADATAKQVMRMAAPELAIASAGGNGGVRRRAQEEARLEDTPGDKPLRRKLESPYIARFADSIQLAQQYAATPAIARRAEGVADVRRSGEAGSS